MKKNKSFKLDPKIMDGIDIHIDREIGKSIYRILGRHDIQKSIGDVIESYIKQRICKITGRRVK